MNNNQNDNFCLNSTYVATLIHDLKTPINAQISAINLLLKNIYGPLNNQEYEILTQIKESCLYAQNLIHSILEAYLYEKGQIKLCPEYFNWTELIQEVIDEVHNLAKEKRQTITHANEMGNKEIFADLFQIKRVLLNLLSNAIRYGENNSQIEIISCQKDNEIVLYIKNYSNYIDKNVIGTIFDKFQTTTNNINGKNCGLGLYLVKQIITAHCGKVFANSEQNGICVFGFSIPDKQKVLAEKRPI